MGDMLKEAYDQQKAQIKKIIIGIPHCQNCARLSAMNPDIEKIELDPDVLLPFARAVGIQSVPFVITIGSVEELDNQLKVNVLG